MSYEMTIPHLPDMRLSMNGRNNLYYHVRNDLVVTERKYAWGSATEINPNATPIDPAEVHFIFTVISYRRRDVDGLQSAAKAWLDGLVDAHWLQDDSFPHIVKIVTEVRKDKKESTLIRVQEKKP